MLNVGFVKITSYPAVGEHLTAKYFDGALSINVDESSFLRLDLNEKAKLDEQVSIVLRKIKCTEKINIGKVTKFMKSTKSKTPTANTGSTSIPLIGDIHVQ